MIDLSHLTDEEQERIMAVLSRDTELKKLEEKRVSNLQKLLDQGKQSDTKLKYLTGEWFYEAKSRRHKDRIHGSEIILASMKPRKTSNVDVTLSMVDASVKSSLSSPKASQGLVPPPKPARLIDSPLSEKKRVLDADTNQPKSELRSPGTQRHNPFNRASYIVVEPNEETEEPIITGDCEPQKSSDTETMAPLKDPIADQSTPGGSITSEGSSAGLRPVPKMRTFASRRSSALANNVTRCEDAKVVIPAPRLSRKQHSQSVVAEEPEASLTPFSPHIVAAEPLKCPTVELADDLMDIPSVTPEIAIANTKLGVIGTVSPKESSDLKLTSTNEIKEPERVKSSNDGSFSISALREEELSVTQSLVDQPVRYDLNLVEKSHPHMAPTSIPQPKLSHQISTTSEGEEGSIAKVLEWFSRSTDSNDWLDTEESQPTVINLDRKEDLKVEGTFEDSMSYNNGSHITEMNRAQLVKVSNEMEENIEKKKEIRVMREDIKNDARQEANVLSINENESQKLSWEEGNIGPKILNSKSNPVISDKQQKPEIHAAMKAMQPVLEASQSRASPRPDNSSSSSSSATSQQDDPFKASPFPHLKMTLHPDHDAVQQSIPSLFVDNKRSGNNALSTTKPRKDLTNKGRLQKSPNSTRLPPERQDSKAEKIRQLKSLWEQEMNKQVLNTVKTKDGGDGKIISTSNIGTLNKRFTKSEYNLRSMDKDTDNNLEDSNGNQQKLRQRPVPLSPTLGTNREPLSPTLGTNRAPLSPSLGTNRAQFNNLCDFWGNSNFSRRGSYIPEKTKPPQKIEVLDSPSPISELKSKSFPPAQSGQHKDSRNGLRETPAEEKTLTELQSNTEKETRSPKARKDSFGNISSSKSAMRRATSMFSLNISNEQDEGKKSKEGVMRQSVGKSQQRRQSEGRVSNSRRLIDSESQALRARAFVPRDYRHYLGMTNKPSVDNSVTPVVSDQVSNSKSSYVFDLSNPARASSPVGSEERYGRTGSKASKHPLWVNNSSSDTGRESSISSTSETRSTSRTSSNWENDSEDTNPVTRALKRAEVKKRTKSLEDITAYVPEWLEDRPEPMDSRRSSNATSFSMASTASFTDPDHLKNMSKSVPAFLQKEQRSGSVLTMYSVDFGHVEVQGNIQFSINYVQKLTEFHIFVARCQGLAAADPKRGRSDPYVKSYLVPDKASLGKRKTSVKKKTLNPTFNEILRYRVHTEYLRTQTLILSVWHHDTFGKNSFLGEVDVDLSTWDFDHTQINYLDLRARTPFSMMPSDNRAEIRLAVRFLPQVTPSEGVTMPGQPSGEVHIWVKECFNLPLIRATIDPFVKCFVLPDTSRKSRQKTRVLRRTTNPIFNHTMVYDGIKQTDLIEACVELTVWDRDRLASNLLGGLRLGLGTGRSYGAVVNWMDSNPCEVALWERMMNSPNEWVEELLPLRMLTSAKTSLK